MRTGSFAGLRSKLTSFVRRDRRKRLAAVIFMPLAVGKLPFRAPPPGAQLLGGRRSAEGTAVRRPATDTWLYGTAPAVQIAEYARVSGMAKIVMGRINHKSGAHHGENSPADQLTDLEVYILSNCQHLLRGRLENCVCRKHIFPGEMRASCGLRCCYPQET